MNNFNNIENLIKSLENDIEDLVQETVIDIFVDSQVNCPVEFGTLKGSGSYDKNSVKYNAAYALYVEMKKQFLRNAYLDNIEKLPEKLNETVKNAINKNSRWHFKLLL